MRISRIRCETSSVWMCWWYWWVEELLERTATSSAINKTAAATSKSLPERRATSIYRKFLRKIRENFPSVGKVNWNRSYRRRPRMYWYACQVTLISFDIFSLLRIFSPSMQNIDLYRGTLATFTILFNNLFLQISLNEYISAISGHQSINLF